MLRRQRRVRPDQLMDEKPAVKIRQHHRRDAGATRTVIFEGPNDSRKEEGETSAVREEGAGEKLQTRLARKKKNVPFSSPEDVFCSPNPSIGPNELNPPEVDDKETTQKVLSPTEMDRPIDIGNIGDGSFGIFSSPVHQEPAKRGKGSRGSSTRGKTTLGRNRKTSQNSACSDTLSVSSMTPATTNISLPSAASKKKRQSQPAMATYKRRGAGRNAKKRETIGTNMSNITEKSSVLLQGGDQSSVELGSFEKKRQQELRDIDDNYELHISGGTATEASKPSVLPSAQHAPVSIREPEPECAGLSSQKMEEPNSGSPSAKSVASACLNASKSVCHESAATSTPTVASGLLSRKTVLGEELKSDFSPIPNMSLEISQQSKEADRSRIASSGVSPMLDWANGRSVFSPDLESAVVTIVRDQGNDQKSEMTRKALRRLSVQWSNGWNTRTGLNPSVLPPPVMTNLEEILENDGESSKGSDGGNNETDKLAATPEVNSEDVSNVETEENRDESKNNSTKSSSKLLFDDSPSPLQNQEVFPKFPVTRRKKKKQFQHFNHPSMVFSDEDEGSGKRQSKSYGIKSDEESLSDAESSHKSSDSACTSSESESGEVSGVEEGLEEDGSNYAEESEAMISFMSAMSINQSEVIGAEKSGLKTPATEQRRNFSRLSVGSQSASPYYLRGMKNDHSPMEDCLFVCQQEILLKWSQAFPKKMIKSCKKIGEGVYGEVFRTVNPAHGESVALKVIPVEGNVDVNGERQKSFEEILPEILIAKEMSELRHGVTLMTPNFVEVKSVKLVQGRYPDTLLRAWDNFDKERTSENDRPDSNLFPKDQLFIVFEFGDGGCDLESFKLKDVKQAYSIIGQVTFALAVAEKALEFEHRDLHIGNILVKETDEPMVLYTYEKLSVELNTFGVKVFVIDFTNSRLRRDGCTIFTDLSNDDAMFEGPESEYQFEIYRMMQRLNRNDWKSFFPRTNLFWLHYLVDKMWKTMRYSGKSLDSLNDKASIEAREVFRNLVDNDDELINFERSQDLFQEDGVFSKIVDLLLLE